MAQCFKCNQQADDGEFLCNYCACEDLFDMSTSNDTPDYNSMRLGPNKWEREIWQIQSGIYYSAEEGAIQIKDNSVINGNYDGWKKFFCKYEVQTIGLDGVSDFYQE